MNYQHPMEEQKLSALLQNKLIQAVIEVYQTAYADWIEFAELRNRNFLITSKTNAHVCEMYRLAGNRLGIKQTIPLYMEFGYEYKARVAGTESNCAVIVTSKALEDLTREQLLALFGRQLAHISYGHVKYLNMDQLIDTLLQKIPFAGTAASETAKAMMMDWKQCSQMTADRGGAIASGSVDAVWDLLLYSMGGGIQKYENSFRKEQVLYDGDYRIEGTAAEIVVQNVLRSIDEPFGSRRIIHLSRWGKSEWCRKNLPQIYYNSRYGTEFDTPDTSEEDLRKAASCQKSDIDKAIFWMHSAAQKGSGQAAACLGMYYLKGTAPLSKDFELGKSYILQSARKGNAYGRYILSRLYRQGLGTVLNRNTAMADWLLRLAASQENLQALEDIRNCPVSFEYIPAGQLRKLLGLGDKADNLPGSGEKKLRNWLWIPEQDMVCAAEILGNMPANTEAIAICDSGIYLCRTDRQPQWITWGRFMKGALDLKMYSEILELRLDGHLIWRSAEKGEEGTIVQKLITISKAYKR